MSKNSVARAAPRPATADHLAIAHTLADVSAPAIMRHFRKAVAIADKKAAFGFDPVTAADEAAERTISKYLKRHHPDHGIHGEEYGVRLGTSSLVWVIDPIDGTKGFLVGSPMWGTLIGLRDGATPVLGMMNQPFTGERIWGTAKGSYWRVGDSPARRIRTRACARLADAALAATHPDMFDPDALASFETVRRQAKFSRFGGDCYFYALLAAGHIDLVIEAGLKPHDIVALIPIIEGAGGVVTTWTGGPATEGGRIIASGDPALHEKAMKALAAR
ncbi:MAG TPA: histidinol-phosphatase [Hyphomicrobiaceae bacterium]|nr:histidinol-phosphatase [Hyphomicrobiaceae bacterium]